MWNSRWPNQFEDELIFVGALVGSKDITKSSLPLSLKIIQQPQRIMINTPIAGEIDIDGLHGRIGTSISLTKPGTCVWDIRSVAGGLYQIRLRSRVQIPQSIVVNR